MKKCILSLALVICLALGMSMNAVAVHVDGVAGVDELQVLVDGKAVKLDAPAQVIDHVTYVSYLPVVQAILPQATAVWGNDRAVVTAPGLTMSIYLNMPYLEVNGCLLPMSQEVRTEGGLLLMPVRILAQALGAGVEWDEQSRRVLITTGVSPIPTEATYYNQDDFYWLSHIIHAESGNQPMEGKIAVGNVVLNRVASSQFPNTIEGVVFQRNQFTPAFNGAIYKTPSADSILATKLCLAGANTVGNALYFLNPRIASSHWAPRNRPYVATIGAHAFYA